MLIGTDRGEWLSVTSGDRLDPLADTGPVSDAVDHGDGTLTVACWAPMLKQLRSGSWTDLALSAPATLTEPSSGRSIAITPVPPREVRR